MTRNYAHFKTVAFTYGIDPQVLETVRAWVETEINWHEDWPVNAEDDLGYSELADITTLDQGLKKMKQASDMWRAEGKRAYHKWLKDAGGRPGKGFYRIALKTYYLLN